MADRSVAVHLRAEVAGFKRGMQEADASTQSTIRQLTALDATGEKSRRGMDAIGGAAGRMAFVTAAGLAATGKAAVDWESQWAGVTKTVNGTDAELQQLEGDLREMARTLPASHQEIAAVAEAAGQLGVETGSVAEFTETMIALGETTNLTADQAATSIARFTNIMGTAPGEVENLGSALVDLGNNSATTEAEILELGTRLAAAGAIAGLTESDVLAFASTLTSVGVEAEAGGTALSKVFTSMRDAAIDGGEDLETFASTAGVTAAEFQQQWGEDPASAVNSFIQGLGRMNEAGESTSGVFDALSLTDQRLMRALLSTAESGDLLTESLNRGADAYGENTALAEEFGKRQETTGAQVRVAWNNIKDAAIEAGDVLLPIIAQAADGASTLAQSFGKLPGPVQDTVMAMGGLTALFGGGLWFTSKTINGIATMRGAMADLGGSSSRAARGLGAVGRTAPALAAVAVAVAGINSAINAHNSVESSDMLRDIEAFADGRTSDNIEKLSADFEVLAEDIDASWFGIGKSGQELQNELKTLGGALGDTRLDTALKNFEQWDEVLAGMVEAGEGGRAAKVFEDIVDMATESGLSAKDAKAQFDSYATALDNTESSSEGAGNATQSLIDMLGGALGPLDQNTDATQSSADAMGAAADSADGFADSLQKLNGLLEGRAGLRDYEAAIDDFTASIKENGNSFDINTEKGREVQSRWDAITESALAYVEKMKEQGKNPARFIEGTADQLRKLAKRFDVPRGELRKMLSELEELGKSKPTAQPDVADGMPNRKLSDLEQRLKRYGLTTETASAALDDLASGRITGVQGLINKYGLTRAEAQALLIDNATDRIGAIRGRLAALHGTQASIYVNTYEQRVILPAKNLGSARRAATSGNGALGEADGGMLDFYASGGMRENHVAQIAPAGAWRVWAEPETGGEAYIPLAMSKRDRSLAIWRETGERLGALESFAGGAVRAVPMQAGASGGGTVTHVVEVRVTGEMDLQRATAQIHQIADEVSTRRSRTEIDADHAWRHDQGLN